VSLKEVDILVKVLRIGSHDHVNDNREEFISSRQTLDKETTKTVDSLHEDIGFVSWTLDYGYFLQFRISQLVHIESVELLVNAEHLRTDQILKNEQFLLKLEILNLGLILLLTRLVVQEQRTVQSFV
jgi:hypothetical protein